MNKFVASVIIAAVISASVAFDCSRVVVKEQEGLLNWLGNITFTVPVSTSLDGWALTLLFDIPFTFIGAYGARIESDGAASWAEMHNWNNSDAELKEGDKKSLRFRVQHARNVSKPEVISLRFQNVELCS